MSDAFDRRPGSNVSLVKARTGDPGATATIIKIYSKLVSGVAQLFAQASDGTVNQLTPLQSAALTSGTSWYGTGFDGNMTFDGAAAATGGAGLSLAPAAGVYTLTRDLYANNITITGAGTAIRTAGYRIFCLNTLSIGAGTFIERNGNSGGNGGNGAAGAGGAAAAAQGATILSASIAGPSGSAAGGTGSSGSNGNAPGTTHLGATIGAVAATAAGANGANGGVLVGGAGGGAETALGGGVTTLPTPSALNADHFLILITAITGKNLAGVVLASGSSGGSGAAASAGNGGGGGGGGASGLTVFVFARIITGTGTIRALGGNGGNGGTTRGGGGGGGAGGVVLVATDSTFPITATVSVAGGTGGSSGGAGSGSGGNGGTGLYYQFNPTKL